MIATLQAPDRLLIWCRLSTFGAVLSIALLVGLSRPLAAEEVDLELILAVDVSSSIDPIEANQQRNGYLIALSDPHILNAIKKGALGQIAISYVEWADVGYQKVVVDWQIIDSAASLQGFVQALAAAPISSGFRTSLSGIIDFSRRSFRQNDYRSTRRVLDVSGDGPNSDGRYVQEARDDAISEGITINGLPVLSDRPNPDGSAPAVSMDYYYERRVIGGQGAFSMLANLDNFAPILRKKLLREIGGTHLTTSIPRP